MPINAAPNPVQPPISRDEFTAAVSRLAESVYDFHQRFNIPNINDINANTSDDCAVPRLCARLAFLIEEVGEHARELNVGALDDAAAEMADVAFVAIGTLLELDALGVSSSRQVANKNDKKTLQTHFIEEASGKLVRRTQPQ